MADPDSDQAGIPLIEDLSDSPEPPKPKSSKRKRQDADDEQDLSKKSAKKEKRKRPKKPKDIDDSALDGDLGINHAIAHMDSRLMADHIAQRTRRFLPEASLVEIEDKHVPEKAILDTTAFGTDRTTESLAAFLEQFSASRRNKERLRLENAPKQKGSPHTLVIAGAGLRAADLTRALRKFETKDCKVAKLFAKHIKLKEAVEMAKQTRMGIGVGTPQRLTDLLEDGALNASKLERIVIDASHIDRKKRGILDMKETEVALVELLTREGLKGRYGHGAGDGKVELLFY